MTNADLRREIRERREAALIVNAASRRGERCFYAAKRELEHRGFRLVEARRVDNASRLPRAVAEAVEAGHRFVIVGGGDGSLSSATGAFAHRDAVLGVLPLGTGNSFAQSLEIGLSVAEAVEVFTNGVVASVDLGVVNGRYFSNTATIGLSAEVAEDTPSLLKRLTGPMAYLLTGAFKTLAHDAFDVEIDDGERVTRETTHQIIVANGRIFGASPLLAEARIDNHRLALVALRGKSRWQIAKMWAALLAGGLDQLEDAAGRFVRECTVTANPPQRIDVDGETVGETPARFSLDPGALRVMVPEAFLRDRGRKGA